MSESAETPARTSITQNRGWIRFVAVALALHIPLFIYPVLRLCGWLELNGWLTSLIFLPLVSSQIISRIYLRDSRYSMVRFIRRVFDLWLGITPTLLGLLLVAELIVRVVDVNTVTVAWWVIDLSLLTATTGFIIALYPTVRKIRLESPKIDKPLRFVQISDVHIGSRSIRFLEKVMRQVNQLEASFLCITGDFVDASGVSEDDLRSLQSFAGPIYFCTGNHEKYEDLDAIVERLGNLGVTVLRNQSVTQNGVQFIGIDDMEDALQVGRQLARIDILTGFYVILLYHRPRGLEAAAAAGVDLMLSGHTHNGQIVPFNLVVKRAFERIRGLYYHGKTTLYVSTGTGTWGPIMRLGTRSEITLIEVHPAN